MILGLKLSRRLIAAVGLDEEAFTFSDSRFVPSRSAELAAIGRYFHTLLTQTHPASVYVYSPEGAGRTTDILRDALEQAAGALGIPVKPLGRLAIFGSFGIAPVRTRRELREVLLPLWPALTEGKTQRQTALAEAAAAALIGQVYNRWPPL